MEVLYDLSYIIWWHRPCIKCWLKQATGNWVWIVHRWVEFIFSDNFNVGLSALATLWWITAVQANNLHANMTKMTSIRFLNFRQQILPYSLSIIEIKIISYWYNSRHFGRLLKSLTLFKICPVILSQQSCFSTLKWH